MYATLDWMHLRCILLGALAALLAEFASMRPAVCIEGASSDVADSLRPTGDLARYGPNAPTGRITFVAGEA